MVGVGDGEHLAGLGDRFAREAERIAGAVQPLVVVAHDVGHVLIGGQVREDFGALLGVLADVGPLVVVEGRVLAQDGVGRADLAQIVQEAGEVDLLGFAFAHAGSQRHVAAVHRHGCRVVGGVLVLAVEQHDHGHGQSQVHLEVLVGELLLLVDVSALAHQELEHVLAGEQGDEEEDDRRDPGCRVEGSDSEAQSDDNTPRD